MNLQRIPTLNSFKPILGLLFIVFAFQLNTFAQCTHTIQLFDSWGDGWNGATVTVTVNGSPVLTNITLASGSGPATFTFSASTGDAIQVIFTNPGTFPGECYFDVFDGNSTQLVNDWYPNTSGTWNGTGNCPAPCPTCCTHTIELFDTFGDGWNGCTVTVRVNGTPVLTNITLASGFGPGTFTFPASTGDAIQVTFSAASFPSECYFDVFDGNSVQLVNDWYPNTSGTWNGTGDCTPPCATASGTASASPSAICPVPGNTTLSLAGEDPSATIQWQISTNGGVTWSNIAGATTDPWVQSVSVNSMFRAQVTNGCTSTSNAVSVVAGCTIIHPSANGTQNETISCGNTYSYYDDGGSGSNYSNNTNSIITLCPSTAGQYVSISVNSFSLNNNDDFMYVFDGDNPSANLIGIYTGTIAAGTVLTASSANASGCLSIRFQSDAFTTTAGWNFTVSCTATPASPYPAHGIEDCNGAVVICSNSALVGGTSGFGMQELRYDDWADCIYEPGEAQSQWYVFSSSTNGTIGFEIVPNSPTDYDWAIWGPYNQLSCPTFTGDHSIRCNASSLANSGPNGETGLVAPANDTIEENGTFAGEVTDGDCRPLDVLAGEIYIMMLDNWSASSVGFQLNWNLTNGATLDCTPPLPITLSSMETSCDGNQTLLTWVTESEINNRLFMIEKADEDFVFEEIGKVMGSGTTNYSQTYEFLDPEVNTKTAYYRLVQVDYDGSVEYHRIVASNCHSTGFEVINSNLNNNQLDLLVTTSTNELVTIYLYNTTGQIIGTKQVELNAGNNPINMKNLNISQGIYMLSIIGEYNNYSTKLFGN